MTLSPAVCFPLGSFLLSGNLCFHGILPASSHLQLSFPLGGGDTKGIILEELVFPSLFITPFPLRKTMCFPSFRSLPCHLPCLYPTSSPGWSIIWLRKQLHQCFISASRKKMLDSSLDPSRFKDPLLCPSATDRKVDIERI